MTEYNSKAFTVVDNTISFGVEYEGDEGSNRRHRHFWKHSTIGMEMILKGFRKKDQNKEFEINLDGKYNIISLMVTEVFELDKNGAYLRLGKVLSKADTEKEEYKFLFGL